MIMETILNRPVFVNPLAYNVFPNIRFPQKKNNGSEPAKYTGIIKLTDLAGKTKEFQYTNYIDFNGFSGIVFIDNYTNQGYVRLGVWNIDDTGQSPEPPEEDKYVLNNAILLSDSLVLLTSDNTPIIYKDIE